MGLRGLAWVILSTVGIGILSDLGATAGWRVMVYLLP